LPGLAAFLLEEAEDKNEEGDEDLLELP